MVLSEPLRERSEQVHKDLNESPWRWSGRPGLGATPNESDEYDAKANTLIKTGLKPHINILITVTHY